ncbi:arginyl-tRNA synthetase [Sinosporangium album]|uniref:Arginyl-tRNA synthetase n=1 Tax=Sinosporangium album TaxID=504805 RepID=A0A1G7V166_9ACTN|nr:DALR anticodon-binding domain-containing protein [Sinosporangium album]SDG53533.1 arginyl-tRNA synthetase [Sinosporangium album]
MIARRLGEVLGGPPEPRGTWEGEAVYVSAAALRSGRAAREAADRLAEKVRGLPGVGEVRVRGAGFLEIVVAVPGELAREIVGDAPADDTATDDTRAGGTEGTVGRVWPDFPRTWDNPGFVVRYAYWRACAVRRWGAELGVRREPFEPEALDGGWDRAVLRVLAEAPGRRVSRDPGWAAYVERLALAYHDAHERAPAVPVGDEGAAAVHTARLWLAEAVRLTVAEGMRALGECPPGRM